MQCIRAFVAQQPDELSLEKADIILVHQQSTDRKKTTSPDAYVFVCWHAPSFAVLHFLFFRLGRGDQTIWSESRMGAQVPFRNHNEFPSPTTQPGRRPESVNGHSGCMNRGLTQRRSGTHLRTNAPKIIVICFEPFELFQVVKHSRNMWYH